MDSKLMSCPTCGHSVNTIAGACTYCGAMMAAEGQQPQTEDKGVGQKVQVAESPPPLPQAETPPADTLSDEAGETPLAATELSESTVSQRLADSPAAAETSEPATEAQIVSANESVSPEEEIENKPSDDEPDLESKPASAKLTQDVEGGSENVLVEAVEPESVSDAAAEPVDDGMQDVQVPEGEIMPAVDNVVPIVQNEVYVDSVTDEIQSPPEPEVVDLAGAKTGESESLGDTILLEADDEVEYAAGESPDKIEESAKSESQLQALKIEKDAQDMAAAVEEQKTALIKAQALKKQKAALAKAQALKKQKLVLAKAAALKRKKAVQAKVQALKKQKAAQAGIEAAKMDDSAAANTAAVADRPKIDSSLQADTTMQTLLEKYKGQAIGINYDNSAEINEAQLIEANAEFFSVLVKGKDLHYSYPIKTILTIIEGKDGVDIGNSKQPKKFNAVIKVYPLVVF